MQPQLQEAVTKREALVGLPIKRLEDPRFLTGRAKFIEDIKLPGMLYASFQRSALAHAKIKSIDVSEALSIPSVRLVLTPDDFQAVNLPTLESNENTKSTRRRPLANDVNYVGEPIAMVVADSREDAEDAADMIKVEYEELQAVVDPERALMLDSPLVHDYLPDNIAYHTKIEVGDIEGAFRKADFVVKARLRNQLVAAVPLEPRGIIASYDNGYLTIWLTTQSPYEAREELSNILNIHESKIRVIAPDIGGAFGSKISIYPEYISVILASMKLGRPVKWVESRRENLLATAHGRGQIQYVEAAVDKNGRIIGLKVKIIADCGAYSTEGSALLPETTLRMAPGVYDISAYLGELYSVFTNKVPQDAYRGAGRPEATYLIERTINIIANRLKLDPVEVRLRNFIKSDKFPFRTITGYTYDSGNYERNLLKAIEFSNYYELLEEQRRAREEGKLIGIGISTYVEICGFGPGYPQTASIIVTKEGSVIVNVGTNPHGQGHVTPFAQIVAEELGIDISEVSIQYGDSNALPFGTVTAGSRSAAVGGTSVLIAARKIKEKMSKLAAKKLGINDTNMIFRDGKIIAANNPVKSIGFRDIARLAYNPRYLPQGIEPGLFEYAAFAPTSFTFPFGTHIAMVEVEKETGLIKVLRYFAVDDVGKVINPMIVEGQVHGGVAQGLGQALFEEILYDDNGQILSGTLADYTIPSPTTIPEIEWLRTETPSPSNPLGVKGIGEAGTIASTPAIVNAVEDALSPFGITIEDMPLKPEYIRKLMKEAGVIN